jgi:ribosomal protein S18 acetylase RimI-like enzyme
MISINKPTIQDLPHVLSLWQAQGSFHHRLDPVYYEPERQENDNWSIQYLTQAIEQNTPYIKIAKDNDDIVGFITYEKQKDPYFDSNIKEFGSVLELFVEQAYRSQGVGTLLLASAEADFRIMGLKFSRIESSSFNTSAIDFYEKKGYTTRQVLLFKHIT